MTPAKTLALALATALALSSCAKKAPAEATKEAGGHAEAPALGVSAPDAGPPGHGILGSGDTVAGASLYALEGRLTAQDGRGIDLAVHRGHLVLVSMFYSSCPYACPTLISNLKRIEASLEPSVRDQTRVLLVSIDPDTDTPEVLRGVLSKQKLDGARWTLATTTEDTVREVAAVLGIKYRQADGSFNHSSVITVLDREGIIALRADGMTDTSAAVAGKLAELSRAPRPR